MRTHLMNHRRPSPGNAQTHESGLCLRATRLVEHGQPAREKVEGGYPLHHARLLLIAFLSLMLGVMVYVTARSPATTAFLPTDFSMTLPWPPFVMAVAGNLPTFFHSLGFSLILVWLSGAGRIIAAGLCTGVFAVEALFEIGQHPLASKWLHNQLPHWLPESISNYFLAGFFDPYDLVAAVAGAILALLLVVAFEPERRHGHE